MAKVDLYPDFRELLESLNSAKVKYLVVGGYAVIHYGYTRTTSDLDIWIRVDPDNAKRVSSVLHVWGGFAKSKVRPAMFLKQGSMYVFGREPARVDLLTKISGVEFDDCYARKNVVDLDGVQTPLISINDLYTNKKATGRAKDRADLDYLDPAEVSRSKSKRVKKAAPKR